MPNRTKSLELFYPHRDHPQRSVNLRMKFWCLQISQKNNQILDRLMPYEGRAENCPKFGWLFGGFEVTKISF